MAMPLLGVCKCCNPGNCCQCWRGQNRFGGGCCYGEGDRIRLTLPRPPVSDSYFGGIGSGCFGDCFAPLLAHTYCCGQIGAEAGEEFWAEYEWQECVVVELVENEPINPSPKPFLYPPPGSGWKPPVGGPADPPPPGGPDVYCHVAHIFAMVELSASAQEWGAEGGQLGCLFPLEWWYICSGCKKFPTMTLCVVPQDHRPDSELPCKFVNALGVPFYQAARPAQGWMFVCNPVAAESCPFCIGACISGPPKPCVSFVSQNQQIFDEFGAPYLCGVDACSDNPCCPVFDSLDPSCQTTITLDLTRCDGGIICCHKKQWRRLSCDPDDGYQCVDLGTQVSTLKRVDERACYWVEDPLAKCRGRLSTDPIEPLDVPTECPP